MKSILNEINKLRKSDTLVIDCKNSNRYRVVTIEPDGSKTAYYFTAPIYNSKTRKAVDMKFYSKGKEIYLSGSNASINIAENIQMENSEGSCTIALSNAVNKISENEIICGNERMYPTTNGLAIKSNYGGENQYMFSLEISNPFLDVRSNEKYFALMSEKFRPFVSVSCIGTTDRSGNIISPAKLTYQKMTDRKYTITVSPCSPLGQAVLIEVNLYEPKLFQDTTVESKNPKINNAFGSIGFIGITKEFGEQWLYARPDFSKMAELDSKKILRAILHIPKLNSGIVELTASKVAARFCSFGSNWENKTNELSQFTDSQSNGDYVDLNLISLMSDTYGRILKGDGFILKTKNKSGEFSVIATGDNYFTPQIFEINYK